MKNLPRRRSTAQKSTIAFQVACNGKPICLGGVGEKGSLTAIVQWASRIKLRNGVQKEELRLIVGGVDSATREHLVWDSRKLRIGDEVTIKVVKSSRVDPPISRYKFTPPRKP